MKKLRTCATITVASFAAVVADTLFGYIPRTYIAKNAQEQTLPYRLYIPSNYHKARYYPLVLFLHGLAECGNDNAIHLTNMQYGNQGCIPQLLSSSKVQKEYPCFVVAPQCPLGQFWVDCNMTQGSHGAVKASDEILSVKSILDSLIVEFSVDTKRIYVIGLSMGGFGTWDIIQRWPSFFAAAIPLCGGADTSAAAVRCIKDIPIWTFHGDADPTIPVQSTRQIVAALRAIGSGVIYTELKGYGHLIWDPTVCSDTSIIDWLFAQERKTTGTKYDGTNTVRRLLVKKTHRDIHLISNSKELFFVDGRRVNELTMQFKQVVSGGSIFIRAVKTESRIELQPVVGNR